MEPVASTTNPFRRLHLVGYCVSCALSVLAAAQAHADRGLCSPRPDIDLQTIVIERVVDGDTVHAVSGEKIRVIGINTPEIYPKPERFAHKARKAAGKFLREGRRVAMVEGKRNYDRHNRLLTHVYRVNEQELIESLAAALLREGLGYAVNIPPNTDHWECFKRAESYARNLKLNLWSRPSFHMASRPKSGFILTEGKVVRMRQRGRDASIYLDNGLELYIPQNRNSYFGAGLRQYANKHVEARGWVVGGSTNRHYRMILEHPEMLVIL